MDIFPIKALTRCVVAGFMLVYVSTLPTVSTQDTSPKVAATEVTLPITVYQHSEFDTVASLLPVNVINTLTRHAIKQVHCMALNNFYEAAGEGIDGMRAVSQVVVNRMDEKGFPETACGVINHKTKHTCQFSWKCQSPATLPKLDYTSKEWKNAVTAAKMVYIDGKKVSGLESALFYHATYVKPKWKKVKRVKKVGSHIFYASV